MNSLTKKKLIVFTSILLMLSYNIFLGGTSIYYYQFSMMWFLINSISLIFLNYVSYKNLSRKSCKTQRENHSKTDLEV
jgi:hypothetical protein